MSAIGPGGMGSLPLAGSVAGTQSRAADLDRQKADAADQKWQADQLELSAKRLGDIAQSDGTGDRDADGRLPWMLNAAPAPPTEDGSSASPPRSRDADGASGGVIDLDA